MKICAVVDVIIRGSIDSRPSPGNDMVLLDTTLSVSKVTLLLPAETKEIMYVYIIVYLYMLV